ncbi:uncharacterized protein LOC142644036 [Castanea sativa]|uniref:uncharacterized protein LOC142644036 n=1 Tax=Castanea sativa TaxID=21020 RepID=UPI003F6497DA
MSRALNQISKSPFTQRIERGKLHQRFAQPTFIIYNGKTDPMEHVSHFNQRMAIHSKNETLIYENFDDVAIRTLKVGLPAEHGLRKSLTGKPVKNVRGLMDRGQVGSGSLRDASSKSPLSTISVILTAPGRTGSHHCRVLSVAQPLVEDSSPEPKRSKMEIRPVLSFSDEDKVGIVQPHDNSLVVTLRIGGYDVKKVLVD